MPKRRKKSNKSYSGGKTKTSIIGAIGGIMIGAAVILFVCTLVLNNLKDANAPNEGNASFNDTVAQIQTMLTVSAILLAVMGIVLVGTSIINLIGGGIG